MNKIPIFLLLLTASLYSQKLTTSEASDFINQLIDESDELINFIDEDELSISQRLPITYPEVKFKFLISNDLDSSARDKIRNEGYKYDYTISYPTDDYSIIKLTIPALKISLEYFFYKKKLISKPNYYAGDWINKRSRFFNFHLSRNDLINEYAISRLDTFVEKTLSLLKFNYNELALLEKEKIHYYLCADENEIEKLTGYKARGLYYLPYDYIISTYNSHYHEVLHLLMNYKLKRVPLYTLPFFQEGFAAGLGGRGGLDADVILEMGYFLSRSGFLDYTSLLSKEEFNQMDASMSYSVAGLYAKFLMQYAGIDTFVNLYQKYSAGVNTIDKIYVDTTDLPERSEWIKFLVSTQQTSIKIKDFNEADYKVPVIESAQMHVYENEQEYLFKIKSEVFISAAEPADYKSSLYKELFPDTNYNGEKYLIKAGTEEISVYNLLTNILLAKYVRGFSIDNEPVMHKDGFYVFTIDKKLFDEPIFRIKPVILRDTD